MALWPTLIRNKSYYRILVALCGNLGGSFWHTLFRNKSFSRVLVALSGPLVSVTNRTPGSWWLFLAHSYPQQIVLPGLGGAFWPTRIRNKSYSRVLVALSGPLLSATNRTPGLGGSFWPTLIRNQCGSFLALSYPQQIVVPGLGGSSWPALVRNKSAHSYP